MTLGGALVVYLAVVNVVTFAAYASDKRSARSGARRTPERVLLALVLAGGFARGWLGMRLLRHKTLHTSFKVVQAAAAVLWLGAIVLLVARGLVP